MKPMLAIVFAVLLFVSGMAQAAPISLPAGQPIYIQFNNLEQVDATLTNSLVVPGGYNGSNTQGNWGVFNVSTMQNGGVASAHIDISGGPTFFSDMGPGHPQITGIFYGINFTSGTTATGGIMDLYWHDSGNIDATCLSGACGPTAATVSQFTTGNGGIFLARLMFAPGIFTGDSTTTVSSTTDVTSLTLSGRIDSFASVDTTVVGPWTSILNGDWFFVDTNGDGTFGGPGEKRDMRFSTFFNGLASWDGPAGSGIRGIRSNDPARVFTLAPAPHISCTKNCSPSSAPGQPITITATLVNDGNETVQSIQCTDDPAATLTGVPASLAVEDSAQITGSYTPTTNPSTDTITCNATSVSGVPVTASCSAECGVNVGQCRMTGGSETLLTIIGIDRTLDTAYPVWIPGTYGFDNNGSVLITTGGQIGAPAASEIGPSFGEWEHQQHCTGKKGTCSGSAYGFDFKAGTASGKAKDTTIINSVLCGDPGWCTQARCAPFKQIFWDGIGLVKNLTGSSNPFTACGGEGTLHYFKAHVGDFGEPGGSTIAAKKCTKPCQWKSGGVDINNIVLLSPVSPAPDPFGAKGGEICPCGCGDWYEIDIYCNADSNAPGNIIYTFASFIDTGNFQLHPPVGEHCE